METDYQKIRNGIEGALAIGKRKFIIYPFGEYGDLTKHILNETFGIHEDYIIDNILSAYNKNIKDLDFCSSIDTSSYTVLFTCANPEVKDEVLNELKRYFAEDDITELFGEIINESMKVGTIREPYEIIRPCSTYAPWRKNTEFMDVYDKIKDNSLVDLYRCYELWKLVIQTKKCTSGDILEVGVYKGGTGALIASAAQYAQIDTKVFLCDTYEGIVKSGIKDNYHRNGDLDDTSVMLVQHLISRLKLNNVNIIKGVFPDDVADAFVEKKYRFVHIDVDIYDSAKDIFDFIWKSVESGGIVVFDDYGFTTTRGVTALLDEINDGITDGVFVHNINGHGIFIKTKNKSLC